jgi:steroid 5-alpha reductase family enzyme
MSLMDLFLANLLAALIVMVIAWAVHLIAGKASVVDSFWGPGFAVIAWLSVSMGQGDGMRKGLIAVLVTIWALRLAWHVTRRNKGEPEDHRYADMREKHPEKFWIRSLATVFGLQALVMWVVSLPIQLGMYAPTATGPGFLAGFGFALWFFGFFWEAVGDEQLYRFKSDPENRGKVFDQGLWRYTRHPNYFGEMVMWWSIFFIAVGAPGAWWSIIGPMVLTILLLKVSGVSLTDKKMSIRHPDFDDYKRRVSAFIPWPPKE